ncbi:hypothetical protein GCM10023192_35840 [Amycolatopsis samaneae]
MIVVPVAVVAGTAVTLLLSLVDAGDPRNQIELIRTGLTVGAGTGGVVALVLAGRRQWSTEHDATERRMTELYVKAVEQLGSDKAAVRHGGLYALERVAQDNPDHRQTVVNVLCGYLRGPFIPPGEQRPHQRRGLRRPLAPVSRSVVSKRQAGQPESRTVAGLYDEAGQEREVRLTAQRILAAHLIPGEDRNHPVDTFWVDIALDLTGATLIDFDLRHAQLQTATFTNATFIGDARFTNTSFAGDAWFNEASFTRAARFGEASFTKSVEFTETTFNGPAEFSRATFTGPGSCSRTTFAGPARFVEATFIGSVEFAEATFAGPAEFTETSFCGRAEFSRAAFARNAEFTEASFTENARFGGATFSGDAEFTETTFTRNGGFIKATFIGRAEFGGASFTENARFSGASFTRYAQFTRARFHRKPDFRDVVFERGVPESLRAHVTTENDQPGADEAPDETEHG